MSEKKKKQHLLDDLLDALNEAERGQFEKIAKLAKEGKESENDLRETFFDLAGLVLKKTKTNHPGPLWGAFKSKYLQATRKSEKQVPLEDLVKSLPYPLGMKLKEVLLSQARREEGDTEPQFAFEICSLMGIVVRLAALILIRLFVESGKTDAKMNRLIVDGLRNPSDGTWLGIAQILARVLSKEKVPLAASLAKALSQKVQIPEKEKANRVKGRNQVSTALQALISFRNDLIHGNTPDENTIDDNLALLEVVTRGFSFLTEYRLLARSGKQIWAIEGSVPRPIEIKAIENLPEGEACLVAREGKSLPISLSPLICFHTKDGKGKETSTKNFFVNAANAERLSYIGYRSADQMDGKTLGSYEDFKVFLAKIPIPPMPPDPRIDFSELAEYHTRLFVGREDVLGEISTQIRKKSHGYVLLKALPGMGKTAILANLFKKHAHPSMKEVQKGNRWVFHFCSALGGRNSTIVALRSLIAQICDTFGIDRKLWLDEDLEKLKDEKLPYLLGNVAGKLTKNERLILVIDALDEGFGAEQESIPAALPTHLPEGVVVILSWRVGKDGINTKVNEALKALPKELIQNLESANPLTGLTREDLDLYLSKLHKNFGVAPATFEGTEAAWQAATADSTKEHPAADPFYLCFLADGTQTGSIRLDRPETIPCNLDEAFESMWMDLPTDRDFLAYRLLLYLAVMRDYGEDALFAELFNSECPDEPPLLPDEVAAIRIRIGKLLIYDGDRYNLFHDRFRRFLVGEQTDPIDNMV